MKLTKEQQAIVNSSGNIRINAVAGSGKTTTIIEYAAARPKSAKILYLAFNKSVKIEATHKFADRGLDNVVVQTAHSLAHQGIVRKYQYKVTNGYKSFQLVSLLELSEETQRHGAFILANHINKLVVMYCNSDHFNIYDVDYLGTVTDPKAKGFVSANYELIQEKAEALLNMMDEGKIDVLHDFYLKKYQLSKPKLNFDYILFDEGQDASPAMLDIFLNQDAIKVIVGDTHQQIYAWRYAINSLEKTSFKTFHLSTSFRFNQDIAALAMTTLNLKKIIGIKQPFNIKGMGNIDTLDTRAILARTNLGLLVEAIEYVVEQNKVQSIYFEGNISSYTYAEEGASLYDILNLYQNKRHLIRDRLIQRMKDLEDLEEYIKQTEDVELGLLVDLVKKYGSKIPAIIKEIKKRHIDTDRKEQAEVVFSTVHRSKGMEYDAVKLAFDFIDKNKIQHLHDEYEGMLQDRINEEINLLYVAITRSRNILVIPENLVPENFRISPHIRTIPFPKELQFPAAPSQGEITTIQKKYPNAFKEWNYSQDNALRSGLQNGESIKQIADNIGRSTSSIRSRMRALQIRR